MDVELKPVTGSANIKATGHDPKTDTLYVQFHSGKVWKYPGFKSTDHESLRAASSIGSHFHKHVKGRCAGECVE